LNVKKVKPRLQHDLDRSGVNMILHGKKRVNDSVTAALGLHRVYVACVVNAGEDWARDLLAELS
jgi:hypothetical protein